VKVAWFTPVTGDTPIVEYSRGVLETMAERCEPVLCCTRPPERFPIGVRVVDFEAKPDAISELPSCDAVFYNLGNDFREHAWIWEVSQRHPGIVVLHTVMLHRMFLDYYLRYLRRADLYVSRMVEHYGIAGLRAAHRELGPRFDPEAAQVADDYLCRYAFTEEALSAATGVVVHSRWHGAIVRRRWSGPVCDVWPPAQRPTASSIPTRTQGDDLDEARITMMTLGPVEPRTGVGEVIDVFAADPDLAARARYVIAGRADPNNAHVRALTARIAEADLGGNVRMLGQLRPVEVDQWARAADVFIDLRHPDDEGFAMSLMYQLPFGKPVVTRDAGAIDEIPDQAVVKIAASDPAGLRRNLRELVDNVARRQAIGTAGSRFADAHGALDYVGRLLRFADKEACAVGPQPLAEAAGRAIADRIVDQVAATFSSLGATPDWPGLDPLIREASRLLWPTSG